MEEPILAFLERADGVISLVGVAVIVVGLLVATVRGAQRTTGGWAP